MRAPELRVAALAGTLNRPACPACGRHGDTDATLVYADPHRGDWISVAPRDDLARWEAIEQSALAAFRTSLETAVASAVSMKHIRVVFDLDELRERLAIWDAGLDDGIVECAKLQCLREQPTLRGGYERIRFVDVVDETMRMRVVEAGRPDRVRTSFEVPRRIVDGIAADPEWRTRLPALFQHGFVSVDRYLR
ncbi:MAG: CpXC domain-containing protein [Kofleriaceae bacterium]